MARWVLILGGFQWGFDFGWRWVGSDGVLIGMGSVRLGFDRGGFRSNGVLIA